MNKKIFLNGNTYIGSKDAGKLVGYSYDYVSRLAREGKVIAQKVGQSWFIDPESLQSFVASQKSNRELRGQLMSAATPTARMTPSGRSTFSASGAFPKSDSTSYYRENKAVEDIKHSATFKRRTASLANIRTHLDAVRSMASDGLSKMRSVAMAAQTNSISIPNISKMGIANRLVALTTAVSLVFGLYSFVDGQYAKFAQVEISDKTTKLADGASDTIAALYTVAETVKVTIDNLASDPTTQAALSVSGFGSWARDLATGANGYTGSFLSGLSTGADKLTTGVIGSIFGKPAVYVSVRELPELEHQLRSKVSSLNKLDVDNEIVVNDKTVDNNDSHRAEPTKRIIVQRPIQTVREIRTQKETVREVVPLATIKSLVDAQVGNSLDASHIDSLRTELLGIVNSRPTAPQVSNYGALSLTQRIDNLSGTDISNADISGSSISGGSISGASAELTTLTVSGSTGLTTITASDLTLSNDLTVQGSTTLADTDITDLTLSAELRDATGDAGTSGQVLTTTGAGIDWVDPSTLTVTEVDTLDTVASRGAATTETLTAAGFTTTGVLASGDITATGTLNVTGATTLSTLTTSGLSTLADVTVGDLTASRLVATDANKNLVSTLTEANLESSLSDVSDVFTNNDTITSSNIADEYLKNTGDTGAGAYTFTGTLDLTGTVAQGASPLVFEGLTDDIYETTISITDPTADHTITIPNLSGEVSLLGQTVESSEITDGTITTADINASAGITNGQLANSTVNYGGVQLSLGASDATPAFDLTDATGLPISTGVSGLGTGVATFLGTPSSANLSAALTDETGSGSVVFSASPTLTGTVSAANALFSGTITTTGLATFSSGINVNSETITDFTGTGLVNTAGVLAASLGTDITSSEIVDGTIVNADISSSAAISVSKTALTAGTNITLSGDTLNVDDAFLLNTGDTASGDYNFDFNTFVIDSANNRVGIGTSAPGDKLEVSGGGIKLSTSYSNIYGQNLKLFGDVNTNIILQDPASSSGNVGIGTTTPVEKLEVYGGIVAGNATNATRQSGFSLLRPNDSQSRTFAIVENDTNLRIGGGAWGSINFWTVGASPGVKIDSSGNLGIGTTTPTAQLHTVGNLSSALTGTVSVTAASTTVTGTSTAFTSELAVGDSIKIGSETFTVSAIASDTSLTLDSAHSAGASGATAYTDPSLFALHNGDSVSKLVVDNSGNVGIGTTTPTDKLTIDSSLQDDGIRIGVSGGTLNRPHLEFQKGNTGASWSIVSGVNNYLYIKPALADADTSDADAYIAVNDTGNVGIGTTSPAYKLDVAGDINTTGTLRVNGTALGIDELSDGQNDSTNDNLFLGGAGFSGIFYNNYNTAVGRGAFDNANTDNTQTYYGDNNTAVGLNALTSNTTGYNNTATGRNALLSNTTGYSNSAQGVNVLFYNTTGTNNSALGNAALFYNTSGANNSAVGSYALYSNTTGSSNIAAGRNALYANTTGASNSAIGVNAMRFNTSGGNNSAIGVSALYDNTTGNNNIAQGSSAGRYIADGSTANTTGDYNIFLGANTKALADNDQNEIVIGYNATGIGSNSVTLGNDSITTTALKGKVGIGTTSPAEKLHLIEGASAVYTKFTNNASTEGLEIGVSASGDGVINVQDSSPLRLFTADSERMRIDSSGNVGIGTTNPSGKLHVDASSQNSYFTSSSVSGYSRVYINNDSGAGIIPLVYGSSFAGTSAWGYPYANLAQILSSTANGFVVGTSASQPLSFVTNSTERIRITNTGNVGIGTTTPAYKLDVAGDINTTGTLRVNGTALGIDELSDGQNDSTNNNLFLGGSGFSGTFYNKYNTAVGRGAFDNPNTDNTQTYYGNSNTAVGNNAISSNTTGYNSSAFGRDTLLSNTTGYNNSAFGVYSMRSNTTGYNNNAFGVYSLRYNTTGYNNSSLGYAALYSNTIGNYNIAQGHNAGRYIADGSTANEAGDYNVFLGANTKPLADNDSNEIVIGHNAIGIGSNTVTLGNDSITATALKGKVGIGDKSPDSALTIENIHRVYTDSKTIVSAGSGSTDTIYLGRFPTGMHTIKIYYYGHSAYNSEEIVLSKDWDGAAPDDRINILSWKKSTGAAEGSSLHHDYVNSTNTDVYFKFTHSAPTGQYINVVWDVTSTSVAAVTTQTVTAPTLDSSNEIATRFYINDDGNVGVGTTSPGTLLTLGGSVPVISTDTSDAADNKYLKLTGGGNASSTRGSLIILSGNEEATYGGNMILNPGDGASAQVQIDSTVYVGDSKVGIGTTSPTTLLTLGGSAPVISADTSDGADNKYLKLTGGGNASVARGSLIILSGNEEASHGGSMILNPGDSASAQVQIDSTVYVGASKVGIGTTTPADLLDVAGDIRVGTGTTGCVKDADGTVIAGTCSSDENLKTNISDITGVLDGFSDLRIVNYNWNQLAYDEYKYGTEANQIGALAQNVESIFPELVVSDNKGYKQVNYTGLQLYAFEAIKELSIKMSDLESQQAEPTEVQDRAGIIAIISDWLENLGIFLSESLTKFNNLAAAAFTVGTPEKPNGITLYDEDTGEAYCVKIRGGQMVSEPGECAVGGDDDSQGDSGPEAQAPVITVRGNNPAMVDINTQYSDMGAIATIENEAGAAVEISYTVWLDGVEVDVVEIDTSVDATYTVGYKATNGDLDTVVSREVIVGEGAQQIDDGGDGDADSGDVGADSGDSGAGGEDTGDDSSDSGVGGAGGTDDGETGSDGADPDAGAGDEDQNSDGGTDDSGESSGGNGDQSQDGQGDTPTDDGEGVDQDGESGV
jgi:hypothetical protein